MPSLAELTDYYGEQPTDLPVEPLYLPNENTSDIQLSTGEGKPTRITVRPEPRPEPDGRSIRQKLMGEFGERYQLWPEKIVREGLSAAGDVMKEGTLNPGLRREDITDIPKPDMPTKDSTWLGKLLALAPVAAQPGDSLIEKAQAISALAGTGGIAGADATLGATPFLRPALKYKDKLYKGKEGQQHQDIIPKELYPEFEQMAMSGEDISHYNFGFVNDKGQFLNREKALEYGINTGLIDPHAGKYGALTSTLMADSSKPGVAIEAMAKTAQPFYSALEHNVSNVTQSKMTGEQWLGTLSNKPGVKPEEMQWTGLQDFLQSKGKEAVTKEQIQEHLSSNKVELKEVNKEAALTQQELFRIKELQTKVIKGRLTDKELEEYQDLVDKQYADINPTKYHSYQLPGGENYKEMLLTLPKKSDAEFLKAYQAHTGVDVSNLKPEQIANLRKNAEGKFGDAYKSSHWDEPNILAHVRMNDRTIDGKKSLHIEEIQSDWHQQGRDKGYNEGPKYEARKVDEGHGWRVFNRKTNESQGLTYNEDTVKALVEKSNDLAKANVVPDAPFKKSWHELALKRMIREAAEKGYDRLSWTPGEAQAARYDLSKQVDKINLVPDPSGKFRIDAFKNNNKVIEHFAKDENEIASVVGKEAAKKLLENRNQHGAATLAGQDLKIGGEGMKGFYDQIIPKALEKLGKEHGVKVKQEKINFTGGKKVSGAVDGEGIGNIHYIDIPQSLRDAAIHKGFPLFSKGGHMLVPVDHEPDFGDK